ncbi:hypothetical protein IWQ56_004650, partial [Coemansia nantahalensis]
LPRLGSAIALSDTVAGPEAGADGELRLLAADGAPHRPAPEIGASILANLLFCWAREALAVSDERQLQPDDLCDPPPHHSQASAWARFRGCAVPGSGVGWQLARAFSPQLAVQVVMNPVCVALDYAQPFFMQRLLRFVAAYAKDPSEGLGRGFALAAAMLAASVVATLVDEQQIWQARLLGRALRNVMVVLLGRKTLQRPASGGDMADSSGKPSGGGGTSEGRVHNILTADLGRMAQVVNPLSSVLLLPIRLAIGAWYMYRLLGAAGVLGTALIGLAVYLTRRLAVRARRIEAELSALNDRRLALIGEVVRGIAAVKLSGWGPRFVGAIGERRGEQLRALWARARVWSLISLCTQAALPLAMFAALAAYGVQRGLDAETTFTAVAVFKIVQDTLNALPGSVARTIGFYVSFRRIEAYLDQPEVEALERRIGSDGMCSDGSADLAFEDATLAWGAVAPGRTPFTLNSLSVRFPREALTVIGGPTGSGKSSLLAALVGEMELVCGRVHLPTAAAGGGLVLDDVAYVPQEPWLRNATVRDNILFGERHDAARYAAVLRACALGPDLRALPASDQTEIGERGVTLSGGQRQRVALARAVYSARRTLLIDDCLSAVDAQTGRHILHRCLLDTDGLMAGRTRLLVTHHMAMCLPHADHVVMLHGGR